MDHGELLSTMGTKDASVCDVMSYLSSIVLNLVRIEAGSELYKLSKTQDFGGLTCSRKCSHLYDIVFFV